MYRLLPCLLVLLVISCGLPSGPTAIRLIDRFESTNVEGSVSEAVELPEPTEWRFAEPKAPDLGPTQGWKVAAGAAGLTLRDGNLAGRSTGPVPILHVERTPEPDNPDPLHAVEIRLRVSAGANLAIAFQSEEELNLQRAQMSFGLFPWGTTPIVAGEEMLTYTFTGGGSVDASGARHILLRPTDTAGATFEIESVRLIFRREHLAELPSGIGWQGLSEIYRETLVARAPEVIRMDLDLPGRPWLDLAIGTIEDGPVTFRLGVSEKSAVNGEEGETVLLERTLTRPHRWEPVAVDLGDYARQSVFLSLALSSGKEGAIGLWGSPVVRNRGARPEATADRGNGAPSQGPPQGVILLMVDTLRADHLNAYGYERPTAPTLAGLVAQGTLFSDCVAQATWTKVSTPSIMTGLYPTSHGVTEFTDRLPASAVTLAEAFREAGYATVSYSSVLFTGKFTNLHQGFEELHEASSLEEEQPAKTGREIVDRFLPWLEAHREGPFFAFLHFMDPHDPFEPYRPYDTLWFDSAGREEHEGHMARVRGVIEDPLMRLFGMATREELLKAGIDPETYVGREIDWYDGSIRGFDAEIGRLLERLQQLGLEEKTLIVFVSDHGEEFLEHGRHFHGQSVYGELTHVPLVLSWPGRIPEGLVVEETVQTMDLMPTLLALSSLPASDGIQGQSLLPLLGSNGDAPASSAGALWRKRPAFSEKAALGDSVAGPPPRNLEAFAIISEGWKLIHNTKNRDDRPEFELFEHRKDPLNFTNLAEQEPEVVERLAELLENWHQMAEAARLQPDEEATDALSQEELEKLRSLGYIQ